jgi:hypothetical protein
MIRIIWREKGLSTISSLAVTVLFLFTGRRHRPSL